MTTAETMTAAQTKQAAEKEVVLGQQERESIEALAKVKVTSKPSTPKAKAKGVVIKEGATESRPKESNPEVF